MAKADLESRLVQRAEHILEVEELEEVFKNQFSGEIGLQQIEGPLRKQI